MTTQSDRLRAGLIPIAEMQEAILAAGYQFSEQVFNDGMASNCFVQFSKSTNPHVLGSYPSYNATREERHKTVGWGRFPRQRAWEMAYERLILDERAKHPNHYEPASKHSDDDSGCS